MHNKKNLYVNPWHWIAETLIMKVSERTRHTDTNSIRSHSNNYSFIDIPSTNKKFSRAKVFVK